MIALPAPKPAPIKAVFTDFSTASPWYFQPLLYTHTSHRMLLPRDGEELACVARLVNLKTKGEVLLIGEGVTVLWSALVRGSPCSVYSGPRWRCSFGPIPCMGRREAAPDA